MPGLSGYDVCRMIRSDHGYAIPIIMVSANNAQTQARAPPRVPRSPRTVSAHSRTR